MTSEFINIAGIWSLKNTLFFSCLATHGAVLFERLLGVEIASSLSNAIVWYVFTCILCTFKFKEYILGILWSLILQKIIGTFFYPLLFIMLVSQRKWIFLLYVAFMPRIDNTSAFFAQRLAADVFFASLF